jgi:hypothetical protein
MSEERRRRRGVDRGQSTSRRWLFVLGVFVCLVFATTCNRLTGEHDRFLDEGDAGLTSDRRTPARSDVSVLEPEAGDPLGRPPSGSDAATEGVTIDVGTTWSSPNGATWSVDGGVTSIDAVTATHAIIVPAQQPAIPSDDYTVIGTVYAPTNGEFGILARVQPSDGSAVLISSRFGPSNYPWLGTIGPPEWNPAKLAQSGAYTFKPTRYRFWLNVHGNEARGKMWEASQPEPSVQVFTPIPWSTGRGVGFYTYNVVAGLVLEDLKVTVP